VGSQHGGRREEWTEIVPAEMPRRSEIYGENIRLMSHNMAQSETPRHTPTHGCIVTTTRIAAASLIDAEGTYPILHTFSYSVTD